MYPSYLRHVKKHGVGDTTIDRRDNDGNYTKGNCRWATRARQSRNTRRNKLFTYQGQTKTITDWARSSGIPLGTLWWRLIEKQWPVERAFSVQSPKLK
jgi:hypothetical protein